MPKKHTPDARMPEIKGALLRQIEELFDHHQDEFLQVLEESESNIVKLTFGAKLDFSESKAKLETSICFSQVVKDKRTAEFEDPNQPPLPGIGDGGDGSGAGDAGDGGDESTARAKAKKAATKKSRKRSDTVE